MPELTHDNVGLEERTVESDPLKLFAKWFREAERAGILLPEAMTLATSTGDGKPAARLVLLKRFDERGFVFFTNYNSRKGRELDSNPYAALVFFWAPLDYQVRIEGSVARVSTSESDEYFQTRPRESQIGAIASPQSDVIPNRDVLWKRAEELKTLYGDGPIERPEHWGGYILKPDSIEFWKGQIGRMHDRLLYKRRDDGSWNISRLAP